MIVLLVQAHLTFIRICKKYFYKHVLRKVPILYEDTPRTGRPSLISLREEDYVMAAKISNATNLTIIRRHLIPGFFSYLIVHATLSVPQMILGETTLSFLGLGILPPETSWGALLQDAQQITMIANYPWYLIPCLFVIVSVLLFNFIGDGIRDAADPYSLSLIHI